MTTRIEPLTAEDARKMAGEAGLTPEVADLNIFRTLLRRPDIARGLGDMLFTLLGGHGLDHRRRELVIMRVGWSTGSDYEWTQHWRIAREWFGLTDAELVALRSWKAADVFDELDRAVLTATDETLSAGRISSATWELCRRHLDVDACLELVVVIGMWRTISEITRSIEIPLETGIDSWPPDGTAPAAARESHTP